MCIRDRDKPKETIKFSYYYAGDNTLDQAEDVYKRQMCVSVNEILLKELRRVLGERNVVWIDKMQQ